MAEFLIQVDVSNCAKLTETTHISTVISADSLTDATTIARAAIGLIPEKKGRNDAPPLRQH